MDTILQLATPIGVIGILVWIVYQLLDRFVFSKSVGDRVTTLETNHVVHLQQDIQEIKGKLDKMVDVQNSQGNRLTAVETRLQIEKC